MCHCNSCNGTYNVRLSSGSPLSVKYVLFYLFFFLSYCFAPFEKGLQYDSFIIPHQSPVRYKKSAFLPFLSFVLANARNYGYCLDNIKFVDVFFKQLSLYLWVCFRSTEYKEHLRFHQSTYEVLPFLSGNILLIVFPWLFTSALLVNGIILSSLLMVYPLLKLDFLIFAKIS